MVATMDLIDILTTRQAREGLTDVEFAALFDCHHTYWGRLKRRQREVGNLTRRKLLKAFPDLREEILRHGYRV